MDEGRLPELIGKVDFERVAFCTSEPGPPFSVDEAEHPSGALVDLKCARGDTELVGNLQSSGGARPGRDSKGCEKHSGTPKGGPQKGAAVHILVLA
jgi:hypothetical protein